MFFEKTGMFMWLILANIAIVKGKFEIEAYDCNESNYIYNLTTRLQDFKSKEELFFEDQDVQIIQDVADTDRVWELRWLYFDLRFHSLILKVTLHELKIERTLIVEQCGKANTAWTWYHEVNIFN